MLQPCDITAKATSDLTCDFFFTYIRISCVNISWHMGSQCKYGICESNYSLMSEDYLADTVFEADLLGTYTPEEYEQAS